MLDIQAELRRTEPNCVVYVPTGLDGTTGDTGNEHFLVFDGPDGALMAVWTQSSYESAPDQRIVFARSDDEGTTWTSPRQIAGADPKTGKGMASWGFPMVSTSGRIYVLYSRHIGVNDWRKHITGWLAGIYSDDAGATWSDEQIVPFRRSKWDNPDPAMPHNIIVWQRPLRLSEGKYYVGFTRWISPVIARGPLKGQPRTPGKSIVEFMRFENLDDDPEPAQLAIRCFMADDGALRIVSEHPSGLSHLEEPAIVPLPDGRLFCTMRTSRGHPYFTLSSNTGETWCGPEPMRHFDGGPFLLHPKSPCPIYQLASGDYVFFYHNHRSGRVRGGADHRRPICLVKGEFRAGADQPIWFSEPRVWMDSFGIPLGHPEAGAGAGMSMYSSLTERNGETVFWYPDRKFFLLGKQITKTTLAEHVVPTAGSCRGSSAS